ncbi:hypothetical protein BDN71DRAFT_1468053, partial [Pleurotus eryngii]
MRMQVFRRSTPCHSQHGAISIARRHCPHGTITRPPMRLEPRGAKHRLSTDDLQFIKGMITFKLDIYLDELRQALAEQRGTVIAMKTLARGLARMNYMCKW